MNPVVDAGIDKRVPVDARRYSTGVTHSSVLATPTLIAARACVTASSIGRPTASALYNPCVNSMAA
jgi:hypothetical protein